MANSNTIDVWFDDANVSEVLVILTRRKILGKRPAGWKKGNPHHVVRMLDATPQDPNQDVSEENPWTATFSLNGVASDSKVIFYALGLNAQGKILATLSIPAKT